MLIDNGHIKLTRGPKENRFRPAIDPLFRSASFTYGPRVIGVILTGALDDGVAGLWIIKKYGGLAIVQEPSEALFPSMPLNAIKNVKVDYRLKLSEIATILPELCEVTVEESVETLIHNDQLELEHRAAMGEALKETEVLVSSKLTPFTCPECAGVLSEFKDNDRQRYRCHTGHAFSADTLLATLSESIERNLWSTIRAIQEGTLLLTNLGDHHAALNQPKLAGLYFKKATESRQKELIIRKALDEHESLDTDTLEQSAKGK
jgi:two-component system chemotaxis response regulator CheB